MRNVFTFLNLDDASLGARTSAHSLYTSNATVSSAHALVSI